MNVCETDIRRVIENIANIYKDPYINEPAKDIYTKDKYSKEELEYLLDRLKNRISIINQITVYNSLTRERKIVNLEKVAIIKSAIETLSNYLQFQANLNQKESIKPLIV